MQRLVALLMVIATPVAFAIEEPEYTIVDEIDQIEIREYQGYLVAGVTVSGDMGKVANRAFDPLFGYISGSNGFEQKIDMTAPVEQVRDGHAYRVNFVMPSSFTMDDLPAPTDDRVTLDEVSGGQLAHGAAPPLGPLQDGAGGEAWRSRTRDVIPAQARCCPE